MFSIAEVQTKVINWNGTNKSCLLQIVHTKAIAALAQFCDFFPLDSILKYIFKSAKTEFSFSKFQPKLYCILIMNFHHNQGCTQDFLVGEEVLREIPSRDNYMRRRRRRRSFGSF